MPDERCDRHNPKLLDSCPMRHTCVCRGSVRNSESWCYACDTLPVGLQKGHLL